MNRAIRRSALLAALVLALPSFSFAQAKPAGDLTIAFGSLATESLDPMLGGVVVKYYLSLMFDYLVGVTPDGRLSPDAGIAQWWEASSDHKRWTFHLRRGVKFHNGQELTSDDVRFSILRALGKRSTTGYAQPLRALIQDIEAPAPDRVVVVTKEPTLIIPAYLSRALSTEGMILPRKYVESVGDERFARAPIGSGPYRFVEQVTGSHLKLEALDHHWRLGTPRYRNVIFKMVREDTTRIAMLRRGDADLIDVSRDRVKEVERGGFPVYVRREDTILGVWPLVPWNAIPFRDRRVREAMNLAIDRKELADTIFGGMADPAYIQDGLTWSYHDIGFKPTPDLAYAPDPARAKALLAEAGYPGGFPLDVYAYPLPGLPEGRAMAEALAGYWQRIGIKPKVIPVDYPAFRKHWFDQDQPGAIGYYNTANRDWLGTLALLDKAASADSRGASLADREVDQMVREVMRLTDREKINALMRQILLRIRREHLGIPLVYLHTPYASAKKIARWNPGSVMFDLNVDELVTSR